VATCSSDNTVKIWNIPSSFSCTLIRTYSDHPNGVLAMEWLDEDTMASSGYWDGPIKIWSVSTGKTKREIKLNINSPRVSALKLL
jgi:WD40 repeat protein